MKKIISLLIVFAITLTLLASCGNSDSTPTTAATTAPQIVKLGGGEMSALEYYGSEFLESPNSPNWYNDINANHIKEIDMSGKLESYTDESKVGDVRTFELFGKTIVAEYEKSTKTNYYGDELDYYRDGRNRVAVNRYTGKMTMFITYPEDPAPDAKVLTRDEVYNIVLESFNSGEYVSDPEAYVLTDEHFNSSTLYRFVFTRVINGIKTDDYLRISATQYGEIYSFWGTRLGSMAYVDVSGIDMEKVNTLIQSKLDFIYSNYEDYSTHMEEIKLVRMADNTFGFTCDIAIKIPGSTRNEHTWIYVKIS